MDDLKAHIGSRHTWQSAVRREHTVPALPIASPGIASMPEVLATPILVAMAECACAEHLAALAGADVLSLGTDVQIAHTAATPVGMTITLTTELVAADGKQVTFAFSAHDGLEEAGRGRHTRAIVGRERFMQRLTEKRMRAG
jgi:fluoroacetyl-CoA thioesterase